MSLIRTPGFGECEREDGVARLAGVSKPLALKSRRIQCALRHIAFAAGTVFEEGDFALPARFEARSGSVLFSGAPPPPVPFFLALPEGAGGAFAFAGGRIPICADWRRHAANRDSSAALCLRLAPRARKSVSRGRRGIGASRQAGAAARFPALPLIVAQVRERPEQSPNQNAPGLAAARRQPETEAFPRGAANIVS